MTGGQLQEAIVELARTFGWHVAHFRPARTQHGWRTPVAADGKGWPDLTLATPGHLLFREIKGQRETVSPEQRRWGHWLTEAGADWAIWRPSDWPHIVTTLTHGKGTA